MPVTFSQIAALRLKINDPTGFITLTEAAALPAAPTPQTAYRLTTDGRYYYTTKTTGAVAGDYIAVDLLISDTDIDDLIATYGAYSAACRAVRRIIATLGARMLIAKNKTGAESIEFTSLKDMYEFYNNLFAICRADSDSASGNNSGRIGLSYQPEIAGNCL